VIEIRFNLYGKILISLRKVSELNYFNLTEAKKAYQSGENITKILREQKNVKWNTPEIIELAYDLQAGSYIEHFLANQDAVLSLVSEAAMHLAPFINSESTLLDVGTGELRTLSLLLRNLEKKPSKTYAFDLSWSRLHVGMKFAEEILEKSFQDLIPFVADMREIPLISKSIDVVTSFHALEPNGSNLDEILEELFRIARKTIILFEPSYEKNSSEGKERMKNLGYISGLPEAVERLGGEILSETKLSKALNPLNPTCCYVILPPEIDELNCNTDYIKSRNRLFSVPKTSIPLRIEQNFLYSDEVGYCFPIIKNLPILKNSVAILASALSQ
jgi:ubiquinone/menaquinone biosynthesis C-methylase UbiE